MMPQGWEKSQVNQLYEPFQTDLLLAVFRAKNRFNIDVRMASGYRANAKQKALYDQYVVNQKLFAEGKSTVRPLQAAPPGHSAHNFVFCRLNLEHNACGAETMCPVCQAPIQPASLAADVQLIRWSAVRPEGSVIPSGGALQLSLRPKEWQQWAQIVAEFPTLRDGGTFSRPDPVHVEWHGWNYKTHTLQC
jgi:hypothetical protein